MRLSSRKVTTYGICALFLILPLLFIPNVFNPYELPKFIFFVTTVEVLAILHFFPFLKIRQSNHPIRVGLLTLLIVSFGIIVLFADIAGLDPKISLLGSTYRHQGFLTLLSGILLYLLVHETNQKRVKKYSMMWNNTFVLSTSLICLFALWQAVSFYLFHDIHIPTYQNRIVGTMGNPNFLGGYLVILLPFVVEQTKGFLGKWRPLLAILIVLTIVLTQSRSALFATAIVAIVYTLTKMNPPTAQRLWVLLGSAFFLPASSTRTEPGGIRKCEIKNRRFVLIVVSGLLSFAILAVVILFAKSLTVTPKESSAYTHEDVERCLYLAPENILGKLTILLYESPLFSSRSSLCESRLSFWMEGVKVVLERPLLGIGQENFELIFPKDLMLKVDNAHNIFLEVAVSSGIIGLIVFLMIVFFALRQATLPVRLSLLAFLIVAQFNPLSIAQIALFWFLLGAQSVNS